MVSRPNSPPRLVRASGPLLVLGLAWATSPAHAEVAGRVSPAVVQEAHTNFRSAFDQGGMSGVTGMIKTCYAAAGRRQDAEILCILEDYSAARLDRAIRHLTIQKTGRDPGPVNSYFDDATFGARMRAYAVPIFGSLQGAGRYYWRTPDDVIAR